MQLTVVPAAPDSTVRMPPNRDLTYNPQFSVHRAICPDFGTAYPALVQHQPRLNQADRRLPGHRPAMPGLRDRECLCGMIRYEQEDGEAAPEPCHAIHGSWVDLSEHSHTGADSLVRRGANRKSW